MCAAVLPWESRCVGSTPLDTTLRTRSGEPVAAATATRLVPSRSMNLSSRASSGPPSTTLKRDSSIFAPRCCCGGASPTARDELPGSCCSCSAAHSCCDISLMARRCSSSEAGLDEDGAQMGGSPVLLRSVWSTRTKRWGVVVILEQWPVGTGTGQVSMATSSCTSFRSTAVGNQRRSPLAVSARKARLELSKATTVAGWDSNRILAWLRKRVSATATYLLG
mmetsp:Transcript_4327/g.7573  ORF Transcript_4327/g.7573 Transcript_4327/m.7573 type:complete len:222 (+) Transcript_4327:18-683(+)